MLFSLVCLYASIRARINFEDRICYDFPIDAIKTVTSIHFMGVKALFHEPETVKSCLLQDFPCYYFNLAYNGP